MEQNTEPKAVNVVDGKISLGQSLRHRVNVSTSVKGVKTWDCTVDGEGFTMEEVLARSDALVAELEKRYPAPSE